jgi:molybdate transport system substrate-binding protein
VAAAADLRFALDEIVANFKAGHPHVSVEVTFGSSGNLYAQLSNKAPFDMFLSADVSYPRRLVEAGLAAQDTEFSYAVGHIVLWVRQSSPLDLDELGMRALADPRIKKIAIANPRHAPYGRAAKAAMKSLDVYEDVKDRLVLAENIAQVGQFVESGGADIGILALSLALAPSMKGNGRSWEIPSDAYPRLEQGGIIMNWAQSPDAAGDLRRFLLSDEGIAILKSYGFAAPGGE